MDSRIKTGLFIVGATLGAVATVFASYKVGKELYKHTRVSKIRELEKKKKELEDELDTLVDQQKLIDKHVEKVTEICQACWDNATNSYRNKPGYEGIDFEFIQDRSNQLGVVSPQNKMSIFCKELQIQTLEFEIMNLKDKSYVRSSKT